MLPETGSDKADEFIEALERFITIGMEAKQCRDSQIPHKRIGEARLLLKDKLTALLEAR